LRPLVTRPAKLFEAQFIAFSPEDWKNNVILISAAVLRTGATHVFGKKKGKAVPLHSMEALGGRGGIAPTHSRPRH